MKVLEKYTDEEFLRKNPTVTLVSDKKEVYQIFAVAYYKDNFDYFDTDVKDYDKHFKMLKSDAIYDTGVDVTGEDDIIVMQTCSNTQKNAFVIVSGKKIK